MDVNSIIEKYGALFEERAPVIDKEARFARENFDTLRNEGVYEMCIPKYLGGHDVTYVQLCNFLTELGGRCSSTALTLSMHQHLIFGLVLKHKSGDELASQLLSEIATKRLILLSTGGGDWVSSNGESTKVTGGYKINCQKSFCSGAPIADLVLMSCASKEIGQEQVMHFYLPMNTEGIRIAEDWNAMGMKGTGSCTVYFDNVFLPDENIMLKRNRREWHPALNAVSTFTFPIIVSVYAGIVNALVEKTIALLSSRHDVSGHAQTSLGEMHNHFKVTQWAHNQLVTNAENLRAKPDEKTAIDAHQAKAIFSQHAIQCAQSAMEALGGYSYYQKAGIERLYRDLVAGDFHPMQAAKQKEVLGGVLLGLPIMA